MIALSEGRVGITYKVVCIKGEDRIVRRLCDLGFFEAVVKINRISSLGGVYLIEVCGALTSVRAKILKNIMVTI